MGKAQALWAGVADALATVVIAPPCAACASPLETATAGPVCAACWSAVRPLPPFAGDAPSTAISRWRAAGEYAGALREIVHAFKYDDRRSLARPLGSLMSAAGTELLTGAECVVPVPLHPWRQFRRGFNQAALLASGLGLPVVRALWRTRWTPPQLALGRDSRAANVRGAIRMSPLVSRRALERFVNARTIVLVDDVRTTGATLDACADVLVRAGAAEVRALTAAAVLAGPGRAG